MRRSEDDMMMMAREVRERSAQYNPKMLCITNYKCALFTRIIFSSFLLPHTFEINRNDNKEQFKSGQHKCVMEKNIFLLLLELLREIHFFKYFYILF